jgi:magnesium transporter
MEPTVYPADRLKPAPPSDREVAELVKEVKRRPAQEAAGLLAGHEPGVVVTVLTRLNPSFTQDILAKLPWETVTRLLEAAPPETARQWRRNQDFAEGTVGRLMDPVVAEFAPEMTVAETIDELRSLIKTSFVTYGYVTDPASRLLGIFTMRDLLFADREATLEQIMLRSVFSLRATMPMEEAMRTVLDRHYPVYPVCDEQDILIGLVRGQAMFEERAFEITAQAGSMVGVEKEERLSTPLLQSLKMRHPWLQINLLTAFIAAAVVGFFQETVDQLVILALFLPVLAGQSGNTGCQALAVTLRGMTLGELKPGSEKRLVSKEATLGCFNGAFVGVTAGIGMYVTASAQHSPHALVLAAVVFLAMIASCIMSGLSGALVPLTLKRFGFDPATASSIFLTTATDVCSMGLLLGLATVLIL